jgi:adenosylcobinamide kinase/adenosylcobinamide-phosphate guanylyltransferase
MGGIVFVIGGARSGKSAFALDRASRVPGSKVFVATAQAFDREMEQRIDNHRRERGTEWKTHEEPVLLGQALKTVSVDFPVVLVDCLTLWLSNLMCLNAEINEGIENVISALSGSRNSTQFFIVANEVGMGIVPDNEMARNFRDLAGRLNQRVAEIADEVFLMAAGIPVKIK